MQLYIYYMQIKAVFIVQTEQLQISLTQSEIQTLIWNVQIRTFVVTLSQTVRRNGKNEITVQP
jgi:hypothetical protein